MRKKRLVVAAVWMAVFASGCPENFPKPPFDTTGVYEGTWKGKSNEEDPQQVRKCPLTIQLAQDVNAGWPGDHGVTGTVTIDYSCIDLPEWIETPPPSVVNVSGVLNDDGTLALVSGGCTTALCVILGLNGQCGDDDLDKLVDRYSGSWSFTILLAGVEPFGFSGTFSVTRV
ncbi:MAG: hypothetical protein AMXMBFR4_22070 [Candidatus Hydrogenedentota bacterium]